MKNEKKYNLLVADDHVVTLLNMSRVLSDEGYQVTLARNGQEAIQQALQRRPDVVLTNFDMPHLNGLDVLTRMKQLLPAIPTFLITAYSTRLIEQQAQRLGVHTIIEKPVVFDDLLVLIAAALAR